MTQHGADNAQQTTCSRQCAQAKEQQTTCTNSLSGLEAKAQCVHVRGEQRRFLLVHSNSCRSYWLCRSSRRCRRTESLHDVTSAAALTQRSTGASPRHRPQSAEPRRPLASTAPRSAPLPMAAASCARGDRSALPSAYSSIRRCPPPCTYRSTRSTHAIQAMAVSGCAANPADDNTPAGESVCLRVKRERTAEAQLTATADAAVAVASRLAANA
jgi:hypothetical protein